MLHFVAAQQTTAEGQTDKTTSNVECLNVSRGQKFDVSKMTLWAMHFSSGSSPLM